MGKINEINYLKNIGEIGIKHAANKPFSDINCGNFLAEMGSIIALLPPPPLKLLDLGCGTGWTSIFFAKTGYEVTGTDISQDMIKYAKINQKKENIKNLKFLVKDYENQDFNEEFDIVVFFDSLHHAEDEQKALYETYKSLKKHGICIVSEPGIGHEKNIITMNSVKKYGVTEKDMPPEKIIQLGKKAGFRDFKVYPKPSMVNCLLYNKEREIQNKIKLVRMIKNKLIEFIQIIYLMFDYKQTSGIVMMIK